MSKERKMERAKNYKSTVGRHCRQQANDRIQKRVKALSLTSPKNMPLK